jgi:hypothetical protein
MILGDLTIAERQMVEIASAFADGSDAVASSFSTSRRLRWMRRSPASCSITSAGFVAAAARSSSSRTC